MREYQNFKMAQVKEIKNGRIDVVGDGEERSGLPLLCAGGSSWVPQIGDRVLLAPYEGSYICLGAIRPDGKDDEQ